MTHQPKCEVGGQYGKDNNDVLHFYCENCGKEMDYDETRVCTPAPTEESELREWFEANFLDGDKIQDGQMLSSEECFDALKEAVGSHDQQLRQKIASEIEEVIGKTDWANDWGTGINKLAKIITNL